MSRKWWYARHCLGTWGAILLVLAACTARSTPATGETATVEATRTLPHATPTESATSAPLSTPTLTGGATLPPPLPTVPFPIGLALYQHEGAGLRLVSLAQQLTAQVQLPVASGMLHIAGPVPEGSLSVPIVYFDGEQRALQLIADGTTSIVARAPTVIALAGAPRQPVLAYTALETWERGLRSHLYVGTLQALAAAAPALSITDLESYALHPLAVRTDGGEPTGVWFTFVPYGIGGDIVFPPRSGLYYLELVSGASTEVLAPEIRPSSLSPDGGWVAFVSGPASPLAIRNLATGQEIVFPLLPDSDRGAGRAIFSPGNHYVAWTEARGSMWTDPSTFHATVRIASISDGQIVDLPAAEIPDAVLPGIAGSREMWLVPAGWLDESTLLLQASDNSPERSAILQADPDGTGLTYLARGILAAFLYPER